MNTQFTVPSDSGGEVLSQLVEVPAEWHITEARVIRVYVGKRFEPHSSDRLGGTVPGALGF